ncbi:MAG: hypothetical protein RXQ79_07020 [Acidilobus sp.]
MNSTTFEANQPQASMLPAARPNGLLNYYAWVAAVMAIVVMIASALAGRLRL